MSYLPHIHFASGQTYLSLPPPLVFCIPQVDSHNQIQAIEDLTDNMEPEPIPIQALSLLLNYERQISEPHYQNVRLVNTSMVDEKLLPGMVHQRQAWFEKEPESVK